MPALAQVEGTDMAELCIVAEVKQQGESIVVIPTTHHKCGRCWRHLPEVKEDGALCGRCEDVLAE